MLILVIIGQKMKVFENRMTFKDPTNMFSPNSNQMGGLSDPVTHFHTPVTTSTSVLGLTFEGGVIIAADLLGSYGSLARFKDISRIFKVNATTLVGVGGDYADYQYLKELIEEKVIGEECLEDGILLKPSALHCWLTRVLYNRRSKVDPLWNSVLVAGLQDGKPFLGAIDKLGTAFKDGVIATGYGAHIATPLLREGHRKNPQMSKEEAHALIVRCLEVLYYRDARSYNRYEVAVITQDGCEVCPPCEVKADWSVAHMTRGYN